MRDNFSADFFTSNRLKLQSAVNASLIVLAANGLLQRSADTTFPFRQDSNFWYLCGIDEPDYVLVIEESQTFLIAPGRAEHRDLWDGRLDQKSMKLKSGIDDIEEHHSGWLRLDKLLKKHKKVHTIAPFEAYYDHFGFYANPARGALLGALSKHRQLEIIDIRKNVAIMRQIKQSPELEAIQSAIDITADSLHIIKDRLRDYGNEKEIEADLTAEFIRRGGRGHAYQPIIAGGRNAATIHYIDNDQPLDHGELLLLDVGSEVANYSADITRTYAFKKPSKRQTQVYEAVMSVREQAFDMLKPGLSMKAYEQQVDAMMAKELKKLQLISDVEDKKKLKKYYPHLTSHFLGLDTHDAADYERPLEPGMVLTVEPGIYIADENIGIRIEDDVLITESGIKNLSAALPVRLT